MDPFHVVRLAGDKVTDIRCRLQIEQHGRRGRKGDLLYKAKRMLLTGQENQTDRQREFLMKLFRDDRYAPLHQGYAVYQQIVAAYRCKSSRQGKQMMTALINRLRTRTKIKELDQLARTLHRRRKDILAHFDREISNGPVEAINGRLEHLRGIALGFRNLSHYILRSLLHAGQITHKIKMSP